MALGVELTVDPATGDVLTSEFALAGPAITAVAMNANSVQASVFFNFIVPPASAIRLYRLTSLDFDLLPRGGRAV